MMTDSDLMEKRGEVALIIIEKGVHNPNCIFTEEEQLPYPATAPVVFCCLKQTTKLRRWCLRMACSPWLDYLSILMILLNCLSLAMNNPGVKTSFKREVLETFIFAFFVLEMLIKMVALGVFGYNGSYLSNNWYKLDFFINFGEVLDYLLDFLGIHQPICQVLGPMRLISRVPSMRDVVTILISTVPFFANALILFLFVIHIFSVVGVQLWAGQLRNRCFLGEDIQMKYNVSLSPYFVTRYGERKPFICSPEGKNGMRRCRDVPPHSENGQTCSLAAPLHASAGNELIPAVAGSSANMCVNWNLYYNVCRAGERNPNMGATNFDNIGYAWITIFQVVTLEAWTEIMFHVMDAYSFWSVVYFIFVTIMGSFVMMNVCAVVIATQFSDNMKQETREQSADAGSIARLTCWLQEILSRYNRHRNRVHPDGRDSDSDRRSTAALVWRQLTRNLSRKVKSKLFERVIKLTVFLSVLTLAIEHHQQPKELTLLLQISNIIFTITFVVEMVLKLLALSWTYFINRQNILEFVIVVTSVWKIVAEASGTLSVLRAFCLLRFLRLLHFLPYLKKQLLVLKRTMGEAATLCTLLLFVSFIFGIIGMHLFGGKFNFKTQHGDTITDRKNFDTLLWSIVTVFQIMTQYQWNFVLYNAMATTSPWAALFFVAVIVVARYVLLNVLVGIVVQIFRARPSTSTDQDASLSPCGSSSSIPASLTLENTPQTDKKKNGSLSPWGLEEDSALRDTNEDNRPLNSIQKMLRWCKEHKEWSFYVLSPQNRFRISCQRVISHKIFDHVVLLFILLSCVTIAIERPGIDPASTERRILRMSQYVFSAVFLVEMLVKVLALGLVFGKESYCRSPWNVVDGLLVILSLVHILVSLVSSDKDNMLGILKALRLLRTLRPLRVIKRARKLKVAVEALIASVKPMGNIVLICWTFLFFYGILGVQLFKGKFFYCVGQDTRNITNKTDCLSANYRWVRKEYNFDNLPQALMSLFVMYSKDGWLNIMYDGLDAIGVDQQPVKNYNEWMLLYFIPFMIVSIFLLDMFIGVMVETFHQCQQEQRRRDAEEAAQGQCRDTRVSEPQQMPYYTNYSPFRRSIHTLCTSNFLDLFMAVIIFGSVFIMAFEHYNQPPVFEKLVEYSYYVFTVFLIIEVLLKLVGIGLRRFLQVSWNLLDVAIVLISITSISFNLMKMADVIPINPSILRVCRILRLGRVLKAKKIQVLLKTIISTLSQVGNICLLFTFFFFIYAAMGVELFGKLECTDDYPCWALHRHANFRHFGMALLTLYRVCTGDNWSAIMKDTLRACRPNDDSCLGYRSHLAPFYFISFVVMAQFMLVNLVVAAIMQGLKDSYENKEEEKEEDGCRTQSGHG